MTKTTDAATPAPLLDEAGGDLIEDRLRETVRATIEALCDEEPAAFLGRLRYDRDGTVIRTRLERRAANISVLAAIGVRRDGRKIPLSIRRMSGESTVAWRQFLDDLDARGLRRPAFVIVDGAPGLEAALTALWCADHFSGICR